MSPVPGKGIVAMKGLDRENGSPARPAAESRRLSLPELGRAVHVRDPAALVVPSRVVRRVILQDRQMGLWVLRVPHRKSYVIGRERLLAIVEKEDLGLHPREPVPPKLILLEAPTPDELDETPAGLLLLHYWRLLFHARVHAALEERIASGDLSPVVVRRRIHQIDPWAFDEVRTVLQQEDYVLPPGDETAVYVEFAAVFLELRHFAPSMLRRYFPAIEDPEATAAVLSPDLDADSLFAATRLAGAADPEDLPEPQELEFHPDADELPAEPELLDEPDAPGPVSERRYERRMARADRAAAVGNVVRAAILRAKAERAAPGKLAGHARSALRTDLNRLVNRLRAAFELDPTSPLLWKDALAALIRQAARGVWTAEARLLYDLQKVCVDHEREIHAVDVVEWVLTLGRRAIRRPLPGQREILMSKHLRTAERRLTAVRLSDPQRHHLSALIRAGKEVAETRIRDRYRPKIAQALDDVGLSPQNVPERVARDQLVEELLDRIVRRGFIAMGDVRDAISRNNLKLPDCDRLADLVGGDQVLRLDRRLAEELDGVYRRGEFYLRWMQRLSSLAFGTRTSRRAVLYGALPFGGAYVAFAFAEHVVESVGKHWHTLWYASETLKASVQYLGFQATGWSRIDFAHLLAIAALGLFLLLVIHASSFRHGLWLSLRTAFRAVRAAVVDLPLWAFRRPWIRRVLQSPLAAMAGRFVLKPLVFTSLAWLALPREEVSRRVSLGMAIGIFLAVNLLLNSRLGRRAEEVLADWAVLAWRRFGLKAITTLLGIVADVFKGVVEGIERLLYAVDEWLRFKTGESRATFAVKAVLGTAWFIVAYVIRFAVNLLIEPQINPIKHFPVVTVSHKLLIPFIPHLKSVLALTMDNALAWTVATVVITSIPGIFGFLVWELKENWRLYAANRLPRRRPTRIGDHGETMPRLLRRGFHSGTLPKRFAKLRRAERRARVKGNWKAVRKHVQFLHQLERSVRHFVQREFIGLLTQSGLWHAGPVSVADVRLGPSTVRVALRLDGEAGADLRVLFEARSGWLVAGIIQEGWTAHLPADQIHVLAAALVGLYQAAGMELVRQQIEAQLPAGCACDIVPAGLLVWPDRSFERQVRYDLGDEPGPLSGEETGPAAETDRPLDQSRLLFSRQAMSWDRWVEIWQEGLTSEPSFDDVLGAAHGLPDLPATEALTTATPSARGTP